MLSRAGLASGSFVRDARLWRAVNRGVQCLVCERRCVVPEGSVGICGSYKNVGGVLKHVGYGRISAAESRPIEIKPLFHYWPNSTALTFSTWGCNFYCPWCQNHHLSFRLPKEEDEYVSPERLFRMAVEAGDEGFSASFNEPTVNFDYLLDLAEVARGSGLYLMLVTNGYQTPEAVKALVEAGYDGWSIDIKGCPKMKKALPNIDHSIVFRNAKMVLDMGGHVEMVYLVITNTNDFDECVEWIIDNHLKMLGEKVPLHVNKYYPAHKWREPATPVEKLFEVAQKAKREGLEYVYIGNVHSPELESTKCPKCSKMLVYRRWYRVWEFNLDKEGSKYRCPRCGYEIPIRGRYIPGKQHIF
jgi:pyruvate formate lyase activating enzyme